jgi:hypothetical protein
MSQRLPQHVGPPPSGAGPPLNRRPLNRRRYVAGHRQNFQPPQSPVATTQDRNVQWADAENDQIPVRNQEDVSVTVPLTAADLERHRLPVLPAARRSRRSSSGHLFLNNYDGGYSDEESDIRVRSDLTNHPGVSANRRAGREHANINGDGGSDDDTVASLDIAPLLQRIVETNNCLYDFLLRTTNVRRNAARGLSPIQSMSPVQSMSWSGSSVDLERGTVPESHEQPHPRYAHPSFSHDAVESNVAEFPISEANSTVLFATPSGYSPTDPAQSGSQTQSLVLYGTYLPPRNTPPPSIRSRNSTSTRSTRSTRNIRPYWYFGFPYTDALNSLEFATDEEIESDQEARRNFIDRGLPFVWVRSQVHTNFVWSIS